MEKYLNQLFRVIEREYSRAAFVDGDQMITYGEIWIESGKIYHYLKLNAVGKEDFVQIIAKKDIHFFSCMLGVWRAGAAFAINEESYPEDRLQYIRKDLDAKIVLDRELFQIIMAEQSPLEGYEETDPHDACYAVYTSGSTGNPKGVLHEYGNLDQCLQSSLPMAKELVHYRNGFVPPLNFVATILETVLSTAFAMTSYLISGELLRDYPALTRFIEEKALDRIYLPPSYIRLYKTPAKSLKVLQTGSEPANGLYYESGVPKIINTYSMSESGFCVLRTVLNMAYDVAPVGFPCLDIEYVLIDDNGQTVEGPGQGELCFKNEYVRGYIHLPEQTEKAFVDGMYHTADICRRDVNGVYYIVGRNDDMIKINGNRIEPAEIEAAVQKCSGLEKVIAKGFSDKSRSFIAVYYLEKDAIEGSVDFDRVADRIRSILPSYMLPTYYVPLLSFPLNPNGKISKKDLPVPADERAEENYVEPENDAERYFCGKMKDVLRLDRVGACDDFYLIGGDSIHAIELVEACREYDVSVRQIYEYKTPKALARNCVRYETAGEIVLYDSLELLPSQLQHIYYQEYAPCSAFMNMAVFWKLKKGVDADRLKECFAKLIKYHPEICTRITMTDDGSYRMGFEQSYMEDAVEEITVSEDEAKSAIKGFNTPLRIKNNKLYKASVIKAGDDAYFGFLIHHVIGDGGSLRILTEDLYRLYMDESYVPEADNYYGIAKRMQDAKLGQGYVSAKEYYQAAIRPIQKGDQIGLKKDYQSTKRTSRILKYKDLFDRKAVYDTDFFMTATLVAIAWYNGENYAYAYSTYNGRHDRETIASAGFLIEQLVMGIEINDDTVPGKLLEKTRRDMQFAMTHQEYNYMNEHIGDGSDMVRFIYQKDTLYAEYKMDLLGDRIDVGDKEVIPGILSVNIIDVTGHEKLDLVIRYCLDNYKQESIDRFTELLRRAVIYLESEAD